jgi:hypothetical protein
VVAEADLDDESSRDPTRLQPEEEDPEKRMGWQSCPAATKASSDVHARATKGREAMRML